MVTTYSGYVKLDSKPAYTEGPTPLRVFGSSVKLVQGRAAPETPCFHRPEKPRSGLSQVGGQERDMVTVTVIEVIG
ncbi:hypothetical protein KAM333_38150 [Aeromonas caviae]|nr:hypothetical protein KAM333_38150 [Aeromonas caviae]